MLVLLRLFSSRFYISPTPADTRSVPRRDAGAVRRRSTHEASEHMNSQGLYSRSPSTSWFARTFREAVPILAAAVVGAGIAGIVVLTMKGWLEYPLTRP